MRQAGWTLIELLVVLILVAILGVVVFVKHVSVGEKAYSATTEQVVAEVQSGILMYSARALANSVFPIYPPTLDEAAIGKASEDNPLFTNVLRAPGVTKNWEKIGINLYRPLFGEIHTYQYDPETGTFEAID